MPDYKYARKRGMAAWSPVRETQRWMGLVEETLYDLQPHWPLTVRQLFYRLVATHGYEKTEKAYKRLCEWLNRGRRSGMLPWEAVRDDGQTARDPGGYPSMRSLIDQTARIARHFGFNVRQACPAVVEVHVEAAGMVPQVVRAVSPLGAEVYSSGGFASVTAKYEAARRMARRAANSRQRTVVLSVGDFDPSGLSVYFSTRDDILAFFDDGSQWAEEGIDTRFGFERGSYEEWEPPLFRRIAVTPEQIRAFDFQTAPAKRSDRRGHWRGGTVQCEAIPPDMLGEILREAVLEHVPRFVVDEVASLSAKARPLLHAELNQNLSAQFRTADSEMRRAFDDLRDRAEDLDWTGGHANGDDDDMEEGV